MIDVPPVNCIQAEADKYPSRCEFGSYWKHWQPGGKVCYWHSLWDQMGFAICKTSFIYLLSMYKHVCCLLSTLMRVRAYLPTDSALTKQGLGQRTGQPLLVLAGLSTTPLSSAPVCRTECVGCFHG